MSNEPAAHSPAPPASVPATTDSRARCALASGSAPLPHEEWMLGLIDTLHAAVYGNGAATVTLPREIVSSATSALITHLGAWRDAARLNWLDGRGAQWTVRMQGVEMGTGRIRDAINMAILRVECGPNIGDEPRDCGEKLKP